MTQLPIIRRSELPDVAGMRENAVFIFNDCATRGVGWITKVGHQQQSDVAWPKPDCYKPHIVVEDEYIEPGSWVEYKGQKCWFVGFSEIGSAGVSGPLGYEWICRSRIKPWVEPPPQPTVADLNPAYVETWLAEGFMQLRKSVMGEWILSATFERPVPSSMLPDLPSWRDAKPGTIVKLEAE